MAVQFQLDSATVTITSPRPIDKLYVEVSAGCNLSCEMCFRNAFEEELAPMADATFDRLIEEIHRLGSLKQMMIAGIGEPFTHPRLMDLVVAGKRVGAEVWIQSNGTMLSRTVLQRCAEAGVDVLVVSHEDWPRGHPTHDGGVRVADLLRDLRNEMPRRRFPRLAMETILTTSNIHTVADAARRALDAGIWQIVLTNMLPTEERFIPESLALTGNDGMLQEFLRVVEHRMQYRIPKFELNTERHCDFIERNATVVRFDGEVAPCYRFLHTGYEAGPESAQPVLHHSFGSIQEQHLDEIWHSPTYEAFRFKVQNWLFPSCPDCRFREGCSFLDDTSADCWTNGPSCANCLWGRQIYLCP
jgi:radical SAM protein with 4Fe4S-binding SPASM domain